MAKVTVDDSEGIRQQLKEHHQEHLVSFRPELGPRERQQLLDQIRELDLAQIDDWVEHLVQGPPAPPVATTDFEPAPSYSPEPSDPVQRRKYNEAMDLGEKLISHGKVAALTVASGQGTRLGFDGPKGNFPISPVRHKTLFSHLRRDDPSRSAAVWGDMPVVCDDRGPFPCHPERSEGSGPR